jgi:short-subunit dehydrogenase
MKRILIVGATSAIAEAAARHWAARGDALFLAARNPARLDAAAADLRMRGSSAVHTSCLDANDLAAHAPLLEAAVAALGGIDLALIAHGTLSDQAACEQSVEMTLAELHTNALSVVALLTLLAAHMEGKRGGLIAVISSVAGDRGRQSNYVYGSAKAMVSSFASGLRQRLAKSGVAVLTVKPGFIDTPMTAAFRKGALWASAATAGAAIVRACDRRRNVAYVPAFWRVIMAVIRAIPEELFKRLKL